jgi:hypothetical protein
MQNVEMLNSVNLLQPLRCVVGPDGQSAANLQAQEYRKNSQFVGMLNAFRRSGGLARAQEVAARFSGQSASDMSPLAGWITKRQVISLEWQSRIWLPLFQFNPTGTTLRPGLSAVLAELVLVYDDWDVASWFAKPNSWLASATPADSMVVATPQVLLAARAERFVVAE